MKLLDFNMLDEVFSTLLRNKSRSVLTAFGIFWGIFLLIFFIGGGNGLKALMSANFNGVAQNSCFIFANNTSEAYKGFQTGRDWNLSRDDIEPLRKNVSAIEDITCINMRQTTLRRGDKTYTRHLKGAYPEYARIDNPDIIMGRFLNQTDMDECRKVCVIGKNIAETLFDDVENPCGQTLLIDNVAYQVVGVSNRSGNMSIGGNPQRTITIPMPTMQKIYNQTKNIDLICYTAKPNHTISSIQKEVEAVIKQAHLISPTDEKAVVSINMEQMFQMVNNLFKGISLLIWIIGIGTLLSGAIGVSNIMMVTVRERTTEIGIRRAIGARPSNILTQIMTESVVLTIMAGLSGIVAAVGLLALMELAVSAPGAQGAFQVSFGLAFGAALLLALLGGLAGLAPAYRALAIKPIDAMRED